MRRIALLTILALAAGSAAQAADLRSINLLTQSEFRLLAKDLAGASSFKGLASATPLGLTGFDVAASVGFTQLESPTIWRKASNGRGIFTETVGPTVRLSKGLPFGLDVGVTYGALDNAAANIAGAELRWAAIPGGALMPAVGLRVAATRLAGIEQLRLSNTSYELVVSKGFGPVTPYLSLGRVETQASPRNAGALQRETFGQRRVAIGGHVNFGAVDLTLEGDLTGKTQSGSGRLGFRF